MKPQSLPRLLQLLAGPHLAAALAQQQPGHECPVETPTPSLRVLSFTVIATVDPTVTAWTQILDSVCPRSRPELPDYKPAPAPAPPGLQDASRHDYDHHQQIIYPGPLSGVPMDDAPVWQLWRMEAVSAPRDRPSRPLGDGGSPDAQAGSQQHHGLDQHPHPPPSPHGGGGSPPRPDLEEDGDGPRRPPPKRPGGGKPAPPRPWTTTAASETTLSTAISSFPDPNSSLPTRTSSSLSSFVPSSSASTFDTLSSSTSTSESSSTESTESSSTETTESSSTETTESSSTESSEPTPTPTACQDISGNFENGELEPWVEFSKLNANDSGVSSINGENRYIVILDDLDFYGQVGLSQLLPRCGEESVTVRLRPGFQYAAVPGSAECLVQGALVTEGSIEPVFSTELLSEEGDQEVYTGDEMDYTLYPDGDQPIFYLEMFCSPSDNGEMWSLQIWDIHLYRE